MKNIFLLFILLCQLFKTYSQEPTVTSYPCLWINKNDIAQIKKDIKDSTLKFTEWGKLKRIVDGYMAEKIEIPDRGGSWEQYYLSPVTGNTLARGKQIGDWKWKHIDSKTKQEFLGDTAHIDTDFDGVIIGFIHNTWALALVELGLAYQITSDTTYLKKAKEILFQYAALYPHLPERNRSNGRLVAQGSGKIHVQDLNEAQWLVNIVEGADLIWGDLTEKERELIAANLLLPAAQVINKIKPNISNIQCWRNTAIGCVGFLIRNDKLISTSMEGSTGFTAQIKEGFNPDGFTKDLSPGYQFFTIHPLVLLAQSALNNKYPVDVSPFHKMFLTPVLMSNSKLMLPPFNDSRPVNLSEVAFLYEWASSKFKEPTFNEVLTGRKRDLVNFEKGYQFTGWNLLFGNRQFQKPTTHKINSTNFDSTGVVLLTKGVGKDNLSCYVKYANQMKNLRHYHNAQLDMTIIKNDEYITVIPGNVNYASPLSDGWYRSVVAHNTVVLNAKEQRRSTGKCLGFGSIDGIPYSVVSTTNFYVHAAAFVRTTAVINENTVLVVDQFRLSKPEPALFDHMYHQAGILQNRMSGEPWIVPDSIGYKYLMNTTIDRNKLQFNLETKLKSGRLVTTTGITSANADVITGYGKPFMNNNVPFSMLRFKTQNLEVITVAYCISTKGEKVVLTMQTNKVEESFVARLELHFENGTKTGVIINPDKEALLINKNTSNQIFDISKIK